MEVLDLYNLEPQKIDFLVSRSATDNGFKQKLISDAERLQFNLDSLLQSFPTSSRERKLEIKATIDGLKLLLIKVGK